MTTTLSLAIGYFDALHLGHQELLKSLRAGGYHRELVVSFEPSPKLITRRSALPPILLRDEKEEILRAWGFEVTFIPFLQVRDMSPEEFVRYLLKVLSHLGTLKLVVVGEDFRFGRERRGTPETLVYLGRRFGFEVKVLRKRKWMGREISTTRIKEALLLGDITSANEMLGYNYFVSGEVVEGSHLGGELGFPTANLRLREGKLYPKHGVYISRVWLDRRLLGRGLTHVGPRPTVGDKEIRCETWIEDFKEELYDRRITVELLRYLRPVMSFPDLYSLRRQMECDRRRMIDLWETIKLQPPWWDVWSVRAGAERDG